MKFVPCKLFLFIWWGIFFQKEFNFRKWQKKTKLCFGLVFLQDSGK